MTHACIKNLYKYSSTNIEIIIVDNNSDIQFEHDRACVIRNEKNKGFWDALVQGMQHARNTIVMCMHNDVWIYESEYDSYILDHFRNDTQLAIAGLFGSRGVASNGGRLYPESNMLGYQYGTHGSHHGYYLKTTYPSVVFDSYCMIFDKNKLFSIDYNVPKYHWTDRVITLRLLQAGFHALTLGFAHDHGGSGTALEQKSTGVSTLEALAETLCVEQGLEKQESWDLAYYKYGEQIYKNEFLEFTQGKNQLWVDHTYTLSSR